MLQGIFRKYSSRESGESVSKSRSAGADSVGAGSIGAGSAAKRAASSTAVLSLSPTEMKRSESCGDELAPTVVTPSEPGCWMGKAAKGDAPAPPAVVVGDDLLGSCNESTTCRVKGRRIGNREGGIA